MEPIMPNMIERGQMILVGFSFFGDPFAASGGWTEENEIGRLWSRFVTYLTQHGERIKHRPDPEASYEVHITHGETAAKGHFEVFVGVEVAQLEDVPVELSVKVLPPTQYAVFTLEGQQIVSDWPQAIFQEWMPASGYQPAYPYMIEFYDRRFKGLNDLEGSAMDVYVPVKRC